MEKDSTSHLAESVLSEFFADSNLKIGHKKKQHKNRYPATLESLDSQNFKPLLHSVSSRSFAESPHANSDALLHSQSRLNHNLKPLAVKDYHRVSDLMHRVSAVSGHNPETPTAVSPKPVSNAEIAANMSEYQLKAMKDSNALRDTMEKVIQLHQEMESVITTHLTHRKDLSKQVEEINNRYIKLFEESLSEMLKTQRLKFKSQTQEIERLKAEMDESAAQLAAATSTIAYQSAKIIELQAMYYDINEQYSLSKAELYSLRNYKNAGERDRLEFEERYESSVAAMQADFDAKFFQAKVANEQEMSTLALKFAEERLRLTQKYEKAHQAHENLKHDMVALKKKAETLDSMRTSVDLRRPLRDNSCQTQVTDNGLWDKQDGWVMPISDTAKIRALWRRGMKFAACPACRGVGKYVHKVGAVLRAVKRGKELIRETVLEDNQSKWSLPDACVRFLSNLPKTAQAIRPHGLAWTVHCVYFLFALKYAVDREDDVLGYHRQTLMEFVIERYLMSTEDRPDAEMRMFHLIRSVKEYHRKHPLLQLFARFMGILDEVSDEEYAKIMHHQLLGEAALKRKRAEGLKSMGARERVKMINDAERQREAETVFHNPEHDFPISNHSLSLDILNIASYARSCLLHAPYTGAYAVHIAQAKQVSKMQQVHAQQLRTPAKKTFSANCIIPHEYLLNNDSSSAAVEHLSEKTLIRDPVPLHLCIGDKSQHWVPMDRAVYVVKHLLRHLSADELTTVYHAMECHSMFLMENGTLDLPEGTHSLIRSTIRLFASCSVDGGFDLSWHDLYHSYADSGNQAEYSAHFIRTVATKEHTVAIPPPILVPIVGQPPVERKLAQSRESHSKHSSGHNTLNGLVKHKKKYHGADSSDEDTHTATEVDEEEESESEAEEGVIVRRLCYTKDPNLVFSDKPYSLQDFHAAVQQQQQNVLPDAEGTSRHQSETTSTAATATTTATTTARSKAVRVTTQEDVLGNHPHLRHYHQIHPHTMLVNLDFTLQIISEAMLNKSAAVGTRIRQIFLEGDTNHDGVLSFGEFLDIVKKVAPEYHERKILKMFREALSSGDDNECIGPEAFLEVCNAYDLVKILDIHAFAVGSLRALSDPPVTKTTQLINVRTEKATNKAKPSTSQKTSHIAPKINNAVAKSPTKGTQTPMPAQRGAMQEEQDITHLEQAEPAFVAPKRQKLTVSPAAVPLEQRPSKNDSDSDDEMPSLAMLPAGPLRIAGMGGVVVVGTAPTTQSTPLPQQHQQVHPPQPLKGRLQNAIKTTNAVAFSPAMSADGLQGKNAFPVRAVVHTQTVTPKAKPHRAERPLVLDDDVSDEEQPGQAGITLPTAAVSLQIQGNQAHKALKITIPQQSSAVTQSRLAPSKTPISQAPPVQLVDDPVAVEAQLAGVRNIRVNEVASKQSAQKLLEQLKAKRESRA